MATENGSSARKMLVMADPNQESAGALQYALSHAVVEKDELILMHIHNPSSWRNTFSFLRRPSITSSTLSPEGFGAGEVNFLKAMRQLCMVAQPKVGRPSMEANNKANAILTQSKLFGVGSSHHRAAEELLGYKLSGGSSAKTLDIADYLIENSICTCVGVLKKGQNAGYLLNTKTHKNFWLLA